MRGRDLGLLGLSIVAAVLGISYLLMRHAAPNAAEVATAKRVLAQERYAASRAATRTREQPKICAALKPTVLGHVAAPELTELSGLVRSRRTAGAFWTHEDSGAGPVLTALSSKAGVIGSYTVAGAGAVDWEDIATGPGPTAGAAPWIYAGDIGDNTASRTSVQIYRVAEPQLPAGAAADPASTVLGSNGSSGTLASSRLDLRYPDGPHNAETLLIDPVTGELDIVSKNLMQSYVYWLPSPLPWGSSATLRKGPKVAQPFATGGDVSADGKVVAVRGYGEFSAWNRQRGHTLHGTLGSQPCLSQTPLYDGQGEALALDRRGTTLWTIPEGDHPALRRFGPAP